MRVAIDSRTLGAPKTGDRTYCLNLLRGMATLRPEGEFLLYTDRETGLLDSLPPNFERVVLTAPQPWLWTPWSLPWDLRRRSADFLTQHEFDGFAIGGLAVGETKAEREDHTEPETPADQLLLDRQQRFDCGFAEFVTYIGLRHDTLL